jgi:molybdate transport system substrate-binding protein
MRWRTGVVAALFALTSSMAGLAAVSGCNRPDPGPTGTLTVFASTSLTESFDSIKQRFETAYPGLRVELTYGADADLAARAKAGPAPDVLAVEGPSVLADKNLGGTPVAFLRNQLVLAVPADNPKLIGRLADLNRPDVRVALCEEAQPCGVVTASVLGTAGVTVPAGAMRVDDVRAALGALTGGSVDAALVYRSDARQAGEDRVATVELPEAAGAPAVYQALTPTDAKNPTAADAFIAYLTQPSTVEAFTGLGFLPPAS